MGVSKLRRNGSRRPLAAHGTSASVVLYVVGFVATAAGVSALSMALAQPGFTFPGIGIALLFTTLGVCTVLLLAGRTAFGATIGLVLVSQLLMFVGRPLYSAVFQNSENIFTNAPYDQYFVTAQLTAGGGFLSLCFGYAIGFRRKCSRSDRRIRSRPGLIPIGTAEWASLRPLLLCLALFGAALYLVYIAQIGWTTFLQSTLSGRSEQYFESVQTSSGYLYSGLRFATGALLLFFCQAWVSKNPRGQIISLIGLTVAAFPEIAAGSRSSFIPLALALVVFVARATPEFLPLRRIVAWLPAFYVLAFIAPRIWRDSLSRGGSLSGSIRRAMTPDELFGKFLGGLDTAMVDAFQVQIAAQSHRLLDLQHGATYVGALASWVPRSIWPDKPISVDEILNTALFPATAARGIGFAFGFYSEPMFNFGPLGVLVVAALFGYVLGNIAGALRSSANVLEAYVGAMVAGFSFVIMRGNLTFDTQRLLIVVIPVLACAALAPLLRPPSSLPDRKARLQTPLAMRNNE